MRAVLCLGCLTCAWPCNESSCAVVGAGWHQCGAGQSCNSHCVHTAKEQTAKPRQIKEHDCKPGYFQKSDQPDNPICPKGRPHHHLSIRKIHQDQEEMLVHIINVFALITWLCPSVPSVPLLLTSPRYNPTQNTVCLIRPN